MGKITIDELSNELKERINELGLTEEQVQQLIDNTSGDKSQLQTNAKGSLVDAINELFQNANNGKELIANAIGEPLVSTDTFNAMSTNINGLLSTFKTNMMNNGVVVEGTDKFKQLIDKLVTLADSEGKGIQYASGNSFITVPGENKYTGNLNFKPNILLIYTDSGFIMYNEFNSTDSYKTVFYSGYVYNWTFAETGNYVNESGFSFGRLNDDAEYTWYAIGVGEEDTTLRDSLASILEDEGVSVTEEDDMASLITKVDEEFDRKNTNTGIDIISATELPATVVNNQIVLITETEPDAIKLIPNDLCTPSVDSEINIGYSTSTNSYNYTLFQGISSLTLYLNVAKQLVSSTTSYIDGYIGLNNAWTQFSFSKNIVYDNGVDNLGISTASYWKRDNNNGGWLTMTKNANNITIKLSGTGAGGEYSGTKYLWCTKGIDFTNFNTFKVTYNYVAGTKDMTFVIGPNYSSSLGVNQTLETTLSKDVTNGTMTYNISDLTGLYYIGAEGWANYSSGSDATLTITCIELTNN